VLAYQLAPTVWLSGCLVRLMDAKYIKLMSRLQRLNQFSVSFAFAHYYSNLILNYFLTANNGVYHYKGYYFVFLK